MFSKKGFIIVCLVILTALLITSCLPTTPVAVTGVVLDQVTMTLTAGGATGTLVATVAPANATNKSVTWSSSAPAVATITNGIVTPLTAGTATIILTTVDGGLTATCTVIVNPSPLVIGDSYGGGKVAYIFQSGDPGYDPNVQHGLIAATSDQSGGAAWGCIFTFLPGADGTAIGTGNQNTIDIIAGCSTSGIAARLCGDLVLNGYNDWFLPSKDELNKLYLNKNAVGGGGLADGQYWSSSESNADFAWSLSFVNGVQSGAHKSLFLRVRSVRAF